MEWDLAERNIDIVDFWRGRYSFAKLNSLVELFELKNTSFLAWAKSTDVELHEAAAAAGTLKQSKHRPHLFDMSEATQIEAANFHLLQQVLKQLSRDKKFKPSHWPSPRSAQEIVEKRAAERGYQELQQRVRLVPRAEFDAYIEKHQGSQPVMRRNPTS